MATMIPLLIAQISDLHLGFEPGNADELNEQRLEAVVAAVAALDPKPDVIVATGDLADRGDVESYERVRAALAPLGTVHVLLGNHDIRAAFTTVFRDRLLDGGFLQYVAEVDGLRLVALDTLEEGRHGGGFCTARAAWLRARLDEAPDVPTLLLMHHPPCVTGVAWMDIDPAEPWLIRLADAIEGRRNVVAILAGHVHRGFTGRWRGVPVVIAPSCAPEVAAVLRPIDGDAPDGRRMVVASAPGFVLHRWDGESLGSHFVVAGDAAVLARYDEQMQSLVQHMIAERP